MTHSRIRRRFDTYLDGTLDTAERSRVESHLAECASCHAEFAELRRTVELLHRLDDPEPPPDLAERILARIAEQEGSEAAGRLEGRWRGVPVVPLALAAGVAGLVWVAGNAPEALLPEELRPVTPAPAARTGLAASREGVAREAGAGGVGDPRVPRLPGAASAGPQTMAGRALAGGSAEEGDAALEELLTSQLARALSDVDGYAVEVVALPASERGHRLGRLADEALRRRAVPDLRRALLRSRRAETLHVLRELDRELRARMDQPAPRPYRQRAAVPVAAPR